MSHVNTKSDNQILERSFEFPQLKDSVYVDHAVRCGCFAYLLDNHTSVQGMRETVKSKVKCVICVDEALDGNFTQHHLLREGQGDLPTERPSLFVYPAQSNYSGQKYPLQWIHKVHQGQMSFQRSAPDSVYVDHAGATLYSRSQLESFQSELLSNLYGNPHSRSQSSRLATDAVDQIRYRVLDHFNTSSADYTVLFTSGCTGALKLVANCFDFRNGINCKPLNNLKSKHNDSDSTGLCTNKICSSSDLPSQVRGHSPSLDDLSTEIGNDSPDYSSSDLHTEVSGDSSVRCGCFAYLLDNHTSVQGMRETVKSKVKCVICVDEALDGNFTQHHLLREGQGDLPTERPSLFVYPAQSNYSGQKYPLQWIHKVHQGQMSFQRSAPGQWFVLLDAASYVCTSHLDLDLYKPDFVTISFYKMFGFPTGIGALLVRNSSAFILKKSYFGGGTVAVNSPTEFFHVDHPNLTDRFEDGTIPFLDIISLRHGFNALDKLGGGMKSISSHSFSVARYFYTGLINLHHSNGHPVAEVYCHGDFFDQSTQGPIVNFNLKRPDRSYIGFAEVDKLAQLYNIHLRTGCFCNVGACQKYLKMSAEQIKTNFQAGHVCGDDKDLIDGRPTGSVRISFGYMSTIDDARHCLQFICDCFVENNNKPDFRVKYEHKPELSVANESKPDSRVQTQSEINKTNVSVGLGIRRNIIKQDQFTCDKRSEKHSAWSAPDKLPYSVQQCSISRQVLTNIYLYPVKSCGAFEVKSWEICDTGLVYDREWMIVSESGVTISQKREPKLCLIRPSIDLVNKVLKLSYPGASPVIVPLDLGGQGHLTTMPCVGKVCGDRVSGIDCGDEVGRWISDVLGKPGYRLMRQDKKQTRACKLGGDEQSSISLVNESQYLLVSRRSVDELRTRIQEKGDNFDLENLVGRFRANLVIDGGQPFDEDSWHNVFIGNNRFTSQGGCSRCQMVCLNQVTGERSKEPLRTLAAWRGRKIPFGIHLQHSGSTVGRKINVGDILNPELKTE